MTPIPIIAEYKGVGIHDHQDDDRISVVKLEIDQVIDLHDLVALVDWAADARNSPESRMLAGQKALAVISAAGEQRQKRPFGLTPEYVEACIGGLNSAVWRCPRSYGTLLDHGAVPRDVPLDKRSDNVL